jgi:hypothetical protein
MQFGKFVKLRNEKFGSVVFDTLKEKVYVTNETGSHILKMIKEGKSDEEIISFLKNLYEDDKENIEKDIREFISELKKKSILE